jgi:phosphoserine aminotransferase
MVSQLQSDKTIYNFCSGPAMLPAPVMQRAQAEFQDYAGSGVSVMEMSHRSTMIGEIFATAEQNLRDLLTIPDEYAVLFLQGGASLQFSAVPLNLLREGGQADYVLTGVWSEKAFKEAGRFGSVRVAASDQENGYRQVPEADQWHLDPKANYLHITPNETIHGVEFTQWPDAGAVPVVADMSSTLLSRPIDVTKFGLIYAGAQKNIGPAGLTLVIVRRDLLGVPQREIPQLLRYDLQAAQGSMINTPPTFGVYLAGLVFEWLKAEGGVAAMAARNAQKASKLYNFLDASHFYQNPVARQSRSWMNIPFTLTDPSLDKAFLSAAEAQGLLNLAGHRSVGGMRASLYNAMPEAGVEALIAFMTDFAQQHA